MITVSSSIRTWTGKLVDPLNMQPDDVDIIDIAHSLARLCRYGGHVDNFLSVARHSIWVSNRLLSNGCGRKIALWGLLHDATEAYMGDMTSPLKHHPSMFAFVEAEEALQFVIAEHFGLPWTMPFQVHDADEYVLRKVEMEQGARNSQRTNPEQDETAFLARYEALKESW